MQPLSVSVDCLKSQGELYEEKDERVKRRWNLTLWWNLLTMSCNLPWDNLHIPSKCWMRGIVEEISFLLFARESTCWWSEMVTRTISTSNIFCFKFPSSSQYLLSWQTHITAKSIYSTDFPMSFLLFFSLPRQPQFTSANEKNYNRMSFAWKKLFSIS